MYLLGCVASPEPWRYSNGSEIHRNNGGFIGAYGASLSNDKPSATTQHDVGGQRKGVLQTFEEWHLAERTGVDSRGVRQCT